MAFGKRLNADDPLTEHDIAERLSKAALRVWRIMYDLRVNNPELVTPVKHSRYYSGTVNHLLHESLMWDLRPWTMRDSTDQADLVVVERALLAEVLEHVQEARSGSLDPGLRRTYGLRRKRLQDRLLAVLDPHPYDVPTEEPQP